MLRRVRSELLALAVAAAALGAGGCGEKDIQLARSDPNYEGAKIFQQKCSGCHTIDAAGTQGSAFDANGREYVDGPNFEARKEEVGEILYAIRNGGFSSGPMPQDIVVGEEAEKVAKFIAENSGSNAAPE
ncbi:MAG TPA: cytochrome c [Solirubrobacteraceae bacterium]|jgi:mono/diheme cytochrome c family protein|nr:cytochrome c [Solirubrobacteraceae bacterium]